uniref:Secreted protein n=1 Tax=Steinernema glaseri TaxID=37863 RepID=A0A1I7YRW5_9BILA
MHHHSSNIQITICILDKILTFGHRWSRGPLGADPRGRVTPRTLRESFKRTLVVLYVVRGRCACSDARAGGSYVYG